MKASLLEKLDRLAERYDEVGHLLSDAEVIADQNRFRGLSMEYAELEPVTKTYQQFMQVSENIDEARSMLKDSDSDMRALAQEELRDGESELTSIEQALQTLLLPKDPNDKHNVFLEIRAGTGGDEAAIFSGDLYRMYSRYAESRNWKIEIVSERQGDHGGYKEIIVRIVGKECSLSLNLNRVPTVSSESLRLNLRGEYTPRLARLRFCRRPMKLKRWKLIKPICG